MDYKKLGQSDLLVSRICLGCMSFGDRNRQGHSWTLDEAESRRIIRHALDQGINFLDTAAGYQEGTSEAFIGRAIRDYAKREDIVLATKVFPRRAGQIDPAVSGGDFIRKMLDASLKRLGTDYIDLYILHAWDPHTPIEETMEALNRAVLAGQVREIGISNCFAWQLAKANEIAKRHGWKQFISMQGHYNLIFREEEREMIPYCRDSGIALTPYSPLASGRLAKPQTEQTKRLREDRIAMSKYDASAEADALIISRVAELADEYELPPAQIALAWLLSKVDAPILGATSLRQIDDAVASLDVRLSADEIHYLEEAYVPHPLVGVMADLDE